MSLLALIPVALVLTSITTDAAIAAPSGAAVRRARIEASYGWQGIGGGLYPHGPALDVSVPLTTLAGRDVSLWVSGQYRFASEFDGRPVRVRLQSIPLRAGAAASLVRRRRVSVDLLAGAGADATHVRPVRLAGMLVEPAADAWVVSSMVHGGLRLEIFHATITLSADVDLRTTRYAVQEGEVLVTVFQPRRIRPGLALGVRW
jgi:hypothetical protein